MRHRNSGRKLGRNASHRAALFNNLVTSLLTHGRIETTEAKAKELRSFADSTISWGISDPLVQLRDLRGQRLVRGEQSRTRLRHLRELRCVRGCHLRQRGAQLAVLASQRFDGGHDRNRSHRARCRSPRSTCS
jgi:ribosomal protein L17